MELVPSAAGLAYWLHDFEWEKAGSAFSSSDASEAALPTLAVHVPDYEQRLRRALAGW